MLLKASWKQNNTTSATASINQATIATGVDYRGPLTGANCVSLEPLLIKLTDQDERVSLNPDSREYSISSLIAPLSDAVIPVESIIIANSSWQEY